MLSKIIPFDVEKSKDKRKYITVTRNGDIVKELLYSKNEKTVTAIITKTDNAGNEDGNYMFSVNKNGYRSNNSENVFDLFLIENEK